MSVAHLRSNVIGANSAFVEAELQRDRQFHPNLGGVTSGGMANHFPMTVLALHGLGASDDEVRAFRDRWPRHRATIEGDLHAVDRQLVTTENWPRFLGQAERITEFRRVFEALLVETPAIDAVTMALLLMRDALPMGLFHPLIRLSFAVEHGNRGLIADALSYMAIRHENLFHASELPKASTNDAARSPADVWRAVAQNDELWRLRNAAQGGSIRVCEQLCAERALHEAALPRDFALSGATLSVQLPQLCVLALRLYLFAPSLTTLHAVTAAQSLADLTSRSGAANIETFGALWARYWVWLTALYLEKGRPDALPTVGSGAAPPHSWADLAVLARATPEVHLIKMAYACRRLDEAFGPEPLYKLAVVNMLTERTAHPRHGAGHVPSKL